MKKAEKQGIQLGTSERKVLDVFIISIETWKENYRQKKMRESLFKKNDEYRMIINFKYHQREILTVWNTENTKPVTHTELSGNLIFFFTE